ncbi:MAG: phosphoglycerate kinase [Elusimicrobiota bacterium]|nr:phosphoglycerate kinase [Elusimicrobiota bacterium]
MKKSIRDINLKNKKVLVRVDYNVPIGNNGEVEDDTRIKESLPTIRYLLEQNCAVILMSHLGRPKGKPEPKYSLKPVAKRLEELLGKSVIMAEGITDDKTKQLAQSLDNGKILMLENIRFDPREEKDDIEFAKEITSLVGSDGVFVQDAFGSVHRAHSSTHAVAKFLPSVCGFLLEKEITYFDKILKSPEKPYVAVLGGAKVSDKIAVIENLLTKVDAIIIGGAMAYTFLLSRGINVGNSLVEQDKVDLAKELLKKAEQKNVNILLPIDHIIATKLDKDAEYKYIDHIDIPEGWIGVDIGKNTISRVSNIILSAKTIVWNGPMGVFEIEQFSEGTRRIAELIAQATQKGATTVVGGGDSVSAVKKFNLEGKFSHISTGGGASLELLEGKSLPGIEVLQDK